jgi:hypothetical protein
VEKRRAEGDERSVRWDQCFILGAGPSEGFMPRPRSTGNVLLRVAISRDQLTACLLPSTLVVFPAPTGDCLGQPEKDPAMGGLMNWGFAAPEPEISVRVAWIEDAVHLPTPK